MGHEPYQWVSLIKENVEKIIWISEIIECQRFKSSYNIIVFKVQREIFASFEVEYDTDFREETKILCDVIEMIHTYYSGCCYHLENEEPNEEYKEVVNHAKEIYLELEEFDIKSKSLEGK